MAILLAAESSLGNVVSFFAELIDAGCALRPKDGVIPSSCFDNRPLTQRTLFLPQLRVYGLRPKMDMLGRYPCLTHRNF
jgi:hypothetical protein